MKGNRKRVIALYGASTVDRVPCSITFLFFFFDPTRKMLFPPLRLQTKRHEVPSLSVIESTTSSGSLSGSSLVSLSLYKRRKERKRKKDIPLSPFHCRIPCGLNQPGHDFSATAQGHTNDHHDRLNPSELAAVSPSSSSTAFSSFPISNGA